MNGNEKKNCPLLANLFSFFFWDWYKKNVFWVFRFFFFQLKISRFFLKERRDNFSGDVTHCLRSRLRESCSFFGSPSRPEARYIRILLRLLRKHSTVDFGLDNFEPVAIRPTTEIRGTDESALATGSTFDTSSRYLMRSQRRCHAQTTFTTDRQTFSPGTKTFFFFLKNMIFIHFSTLENEKKKIYFCFLCTNDHRTTRFRCQILGVFLLGQKVSPASTRRNYHEGLVFYFHHRLIWTTCKRLSAQQAAIRLANNSQIHSTYICILLSFVLSQKIPATRTLGAPDSAIRSQILLFHSFIFITLKFITHHIFVEIEYQNIRITSSC